MPIKTGLPRPRKKRMCVKSNRELAYNPDIPKNNAALELIIRDFKRAYNPGF